MTASPRLDRAAVMIIDMQNGFCHPEGSFASLGLDVGGLTAATPGCQRLAAFARARDLPLVFTRFVYRSDYADGGVLTAEVMPALAEGKALIEGTWDAEIVDDLEVRDADHVIDKNRYSAFYGTRLEPLLTSLGISDLILGGVTTNMCVETTARDAGQRDYRTFVVSDACGELERARHEQALHTIGFGFGWALTADELGA